MGGLKGLKLGSKIWVKDQVCTATAPPLVATNFLSAPAPRDGRTPRTRMCSCKRSSRVSSAATSRCALHSRPLVPSPLPLRSRRFFYATCPHCRQVETIKGDTFQTDTFFPANPPDVDETDHTALLHLSDATLLHNTRLRYMRDEIYTYVGPILVSVNPFKYIPKLYAPELMSDCKKFQPGHPERPAHTFSMAEAAYQQMCKRRCHQSLVVSGESGAGKTEVNKQCMNYLVWRASSADHADLSTRILQVRRAEAASRRTPHAAPLAQHPSPPSPRALSRPPPPPRSPASPRVCVRACVCDGAPPAARAPRTAPLSHRPLAPRLPQSNPILEATGNAKTVRNHNSSRSLGGVPPHPHTAHTGVPPPLQVRNNNSSRFGKYVAMKFADVTHTSASLVGAEVQTFLLEKSRVPTTIATGERNYHIFYHVLLGSGLLTDTDPTKQRLLNRSSCTTVPNVDDVEEYKQVVQAMSDIGMSDQENAEVQQGVAAILCLGNLDFGDQPDDQAAISDPNMLQLASEFLGCADLEQALLKATLKVSKSESYTIELEAAKAVAGRDAFIKSVYQRIFDLLVKRVNESLSKSATESKLFIGLLDVFGFEIFEVNSLEQLCINHTNEKLQNFFLRSVFKAEEIAYKNDGIKWVPIPYTDNANIIDIIEGKTKGIFDQLDSTCKAPKATDEMLCSALHETHAKSKILCRPKSGGKNASAAKKLTDKEAFVMRHFAGEVTYAVEGWLEKNNDKLSDDYEKMFGASTKEMMAKELAKKEEEEEAGGAKKKKKGSGGQTVSRGFLSSLKKLMEALEATEAHFIRCIKPNNELKPNLLYGAFVLSQLKCSGTLEAVELMQRGYPSRIPYEAIYDRYAPLMGDFCKELGALLNGPDKELRPSQFVEAIAMAFGLTENDYQLGVHKIFMRSGKAAFLEEMKDADINEMIPRIVAKIKEFERKKAAKKVVERGLVSWIWRRRIRKLKKLKQQADEAEKKAKALMGKKKNKEEKNKGRQMLPHEITNVIGDMGSAKEQTRKGGPEKTAVKLSRQPQASTGGGGAASMGGGGSMATGGMLPMMAGMAYGPRVVSKTMPIDPQDTSSFSINIPQGAKAIIKQAVEEYKQTNALGSVELSLLDKLLSNLGTAAPPTNPFGGAPSGTAPGGGPAAPTDLTDEVTDAPQLFEYDDIAHSGHLMVKQVDLVPNKKKDAKKNKKKDEFVEEYFILLNSKHLVHFQPTSGFVDPFKKTISGKAIDLMHASVKMSDEGDENAFEITTGRSLYQLRPKDEADSAMAWVEKITETMLASDDMGQAVDHVHNAADRDYGTALQGYSDVKPEDVYT